MNSRALSQSIEDVLLQGLDLLDGMDDETYSRPLGPPYSATVGRHYRHVIDHFVCLARGIRDGAIATNPLRTREMQPGVPLNL
jgi:hypothetical protein